MLQPLKTASQWGCRHSDTLDNQHSQVLAEFWDVFATAQEQKLRLVKLGHESTGMQTLACHLACRPQHVRVVQLNWRHPGKTLASLIRATSRDQWRVCLSMLHLLTIWYNSNQHLLSPTQDVTLILGSIPGDNQEKLMHIENCRIFNLNFHRYGNSTSNYKQTY